MISTSGTSAMNMTAEQLEDADERHHRRLALHHAEERRVGAARRGRDVGAGRHERRLAAARSIDCVRRVVDRHVRAEQRRRRLADGAPASCR